MIDNSGSTDNLPAEYRKRRCIPCVDHPLSTHQNCWGTLKDVPGHLLDEYWCECPCGVLEERGIQ